MHVAALDDFGGKLPAELLGSSFGIMATLAQRSELLERRVSARPRRSATWTLEICKRPPGLILAWPYYNEADDAHCNGFFSDLPQLWRSLRFS
jgi:hypothetical protein